MRGHWKCCVAFSSEILMQWQPLQNVLNNVLTVFSCGVYAVFWVFLPFYSYTLRATFKADFYCFEMDSKVFWFWNLRLSLFASSNKNTRCKERVQQKNNQRNATYKKSSSHCSLLVLERQTKWWRTYSSWRWTVFMQNDLNFIRFFLQVKTKRGSGPATMCHKTMTGTHPPWLTGLVACISCSSVLFVCFCSF